MARGQLCNLCIDAKARVLPANATKYLRENSAQSQSTAGEGTFLSRLEAWENSEINYVEIIKGNKIID